MDSGREEEEGIYETAWESVSIYIYRNIEWICSVQFSGG